MSGNALRHVVGNWTLSNFTTLQSGAPFTVTTQTNTTNAFAPGGLRADVLRNPNLDTGQRSVAKWFDTSAFAQPLRTRLGIREWECCAAQASRPRTSHCNANSGSASG